MPDSDHQQIRSIDPGFCREIIRRLNDAIDELDTGHLIIECVRLAAGGTAMHADAGNALSTTIDAAQKHYLLRGVEVLSLLVGDLKAEDETDAA